MCHVAPNLHRFLLLQTLQNRINFFFHSVVSFLFAVLELEVFFGRAVNIFLYIFYIFLFVIWIYMFWMKDIIYHLQCSGLFILISFAEPEFKYKTQGLNLHHSHNWAPSKTTRTYYIVVIKLQRLIYIIYA
jgi:hypothetical protein